MQKRYTLNELIEFCLKHRGSRAYINNTPGEIAADIYERVYNNSIAYCADDMGICGFVTFTNRESKNELHIHNIIAVRGGFLILLNAAHEKFPKHKIVGYRRGKLVEFKNLWEKAHKAQAAAPEKCSAR